MARVTDENDFGLTVTERVIAVNALDYLLHPHSAGRDVADCIGPQEYLVLRKLAKAISEPTSTVIGDERPLTPGDLRSM